MHNISTALQYTPPIIRIAHGVTELSAPAGKEVKQAVTQISSQESLS